MQKNVENADLHKAVLNKTMATQEQCLKQDFVAPLTTVHKIARQKYQM